MSTKCALWYTTSDTSTDAKQPGSVSAPAQPVDTPTTDTATHLTPPINDDEFITMVLHQLPYRHQSGWTGLFDSGLVAFREDLLAFDQIGCLQRQNSSHEEDRPAQHERAPPLQPGN
ncbi:hypothetical protein PR048_032801 [Dryococelus australis]|uniref:Uncharacterized protein n=1 Tax=Dryococelus australis TaxID=614101 RepID=A0ABQ9G7D0_9NEOP|nr:hypothetical protein PR048_032801 [Dryococelus australis]